jgi:hypothetical protein
VDGVMSELVSYDRYPDCTSEGFPATVAGAVEISEKPIKTLFDWLLLSKLFDEIKMFKKAIFKTFWQLFT